MNSDFRPDKPMRSQRASKKLRSRIIDAGIWTLVGHFLSEALRFGSNLIMTRLLVPEMFGVMALANVMMTGLQLFSDIGLHQGIIQSRRGSDIVYLNTVWTVKILRGVLIWLTALAIAVTLYLLSKLQLLPQDNVYAEPVLPYVIAVLSFNALITGFSSTRLSTANRKLVFRRVVLMNLTTQLSGIVFMVVWALVSPSIWALVVGSLLTSLLHMVFTHTILPGERNTLSWDREALSEIIRFGKWIFLTSILGFSAMNGDRVLLGGLTDPATLGFYSIASFLVMAPGNVFGEISSRVAFPAFSEIVRERPEALRTTYYKFRNPLDVVILLTTGALMSSGHLLIELLYDDRYLAAGHMVEILSISLIGVQYSLANQCFLAMGMPRLLAPILGLRAMSLVAFMPLAYSWYGINGALWAIVASSLCTLPITFYLKIKHSLVDYWREAIVLPLLPLGYLLGKLVDQLAKQLG